MDKAAIWGWLTWMGKYTAHYLNQVKVNTVTMEKKIHHNYRKETFKLDKAEEETELVLKWEDYERKKETCFERNLKLNIDPNNNFISLLACCSKQHGVSKKWFDGSTL